MQQNVYQSASVYACVCVFTCVHTRAFVGVHVDVACLPLDSNTFHLFFNEDVPLPLFFFFSVRWCACQSAPLLSRPLPPPPPPFPRLLSSSSFASSPLCLCVGESYSCAFHPLIQYPSPTVDQPATHHTRLPPVPDDGTGEPWWGVGGTSKAKSSKSSDACLVDRMLWPPRFAARRALRRVTSDNVKCCLLLLSLLSPLLHYIALRAKRRRRRASGVLVCRGAHEPECVCGVPPPPFSRLASHPSFSSSLSLPSCLRRNER